MGRGFSEVTEGGLAGRRLQSGFLGHARIDGDGRAARARYYFSGASRPDARRGRDRAHRFGGLKRVAAVAADDAGGWGRLLHGRHREHVPCYKY